MGSNVLFSVYDWSATKDRVRRGSDWSIKSKCWGPPDMRVMSLLNDHLNICYSLQGAFLQFISIPQLLRWDVPNEVFELEVTFQVLRDKIGTASRPKNSRFLLHTRIHLGSHLGSHWVHKMYGRSNLLWNQCGPNYCRTILLKFEVNWASLGGGVSRRSWISTRASLASIGWPVKPANDVSTWDIHQIFLNLVLFGNTAAVIT